MRDIIVTLLVFGSLPLTLRKPFIGVLVWTWIGLMNPHRLCWGFAVNFPYALLVAVTLLVALVINKSERKAIPWTKISITLAVFWAWMAITTFFALNPDGAWAHLDKVSKIMLMIFVTIMLLTSRQRIDALVLVMVASLGFYGVKGGIFTVLTGGSYHVWGPDGSFIGGNNEIGLALIMTIPLMRYLQLTTDSKWIRRGAIVGMITTLFAVLGTQSRGALLGIIAMTIYLVLKSRRKVALILALALCVPAALMVMPRTWYGRMETIDHYQHDASALGRINAWYTAWNVAMQRPIVGGGFEMFKPWVFRIYAPEPNNYHDSHSIYFEVLGEHGFVGLFLFLMLGLSGLGTAKQIVKATKSNPQLAWMRDLASMIHVTLIGYAVSGAFLGLAYFDYYYVFLSVLVGLNRVLEVQTETLSSDKMKQLATQSDASTVTLLRQPATAMKGRNAKGSLLAVKDWFQSL